jgi:predicted nucleotidyltransferase component of viral defense system
VLIDLAVNSPPDLPASVTSAGPTLAPEELAGHKLLALFDRAAARDFSDVYVLARRFGKNAMLARAAWKAQSTEPLSSVNVGQKVCLATGE